MIQRPCNGSFFGQLFDKALPRFGWSRSPQDSPGESKVCAVLTLPCAFYGQTATKPCPLWPSWAPEQTENDPTVGEERDKTRARGALKVTGKNHCVHCRAGAGSSGGNGACEEHSWGKLEWTGTNKAMGGHLGFFWVLWQAVHTPVTPWGWLTLNHALLSSAHQEHQELPSHLQLRTKTWGNLGSRELRTFKISRKNKLLQSLASPSTAHVPLS